VRPVLFDSSVYITALRGGKDTPLGLRKLAEGAPLWLSAVVLEELYAGATTKNRPAVERLERDFGKARRILAPNIGDWSNAGRVLARVAAKHGYEQIGLGRLTNDTLIAVSAGRIGITVMTANQRDFGLLAAFYSFQWSPVKL
jgi:predicted nucleic acid-binding protein